MQIERLVVGILDVNCYLLICSKTKEALIVDPGGDGERIWDLIQKRGLKVTAIINTHGHGDHIGANGFLHKKTGAPVLVHENDAHMLDNAMKNLSIYVGPKVESPKAQGFLKEGEPLKVGEESLKVLYTPGHTPGGVCLLGDGFVLTGDTLFAGSVGRTDFEGGSFKQLIKSINEKLMVLPDDYVVYPGHGPDSTIGYERKNNPFIKF